MLSTDWSRAIGIDVPHAHDAGVIAATQLSDLAGAERAVAAGVDVVIARGSEGGGHGQPLVGTLPLLSALLDRLPVPVPVPVPVLVLAGGGDWVRARAGRCSGCGGICGLAGHGVLRVD